MGDNANNDKVINFVKELEALREVSSVMKK